MLLLPFVLFSQEGYIDDKKGGCKTFTKNTKNLHNLWTGECLNGFANGKGTLKLFENDTLIYTYSGSIINGKFEGQGTITHADGENYVGQWVNHDMEGQGTMIFLNKCNYVGQWKNNKMEGQGVFTCPNGEKYIGGDITVQI